MRIINKKYLLIILLVGVLLTGVIIMKPNKKVKLDNVILKQEVNNKTFAMYKEEGNDYVPVTDNKFPDMYVLNIEKSKCIDNNGNELENVLSYENDKVTITSGNTTYCYLYFDKSLGLEIKKKNPNRLSEEEKGAMYRFQGQQSDNVENYICFGTSDLKTCTDNQDKYMYRIIGIEAETGRVKVIKKEALKAIKKDESDESKETEIKTYQWYTDYDTDITFPESNIYKAISGSDFLENDDYVPAGWEGKIATNTWTYGDMLNNNTLGAKQTGGGLYLAETGQKGTIWNTKANRGDPGAQPYTVGYETSPYKGKTFYYIRYTDKPWTKTFSSKVSLMYLHDYYYSVTENDEANCQLHEKNHADCKTSWMHLSQNDPEALSPSEWTMTRDGLETYYGYFFGIAVDSSGFVFGYDLNAKISARPTFYINASEELLDGEGTITDPFIIN